MFNDIHPDEPCFIHSPIESMDKILKWTIQMKATEHFFPVALLIML